MPTRYGWWRGSTTRCTTQLYRIVPDRAERTRRAHDNLRRELDGLTLAGH